MIQKTHCLQLTVLVSLVLKDFLYSNSFTGLQAPCLDIHPRNSRLIMLSNVIIKTSSRKPLHLKMTAFCKLLPSLPETPLRRILVPQYAQPCNSLSENRKGIIQKTTHIIRKKILQCYMNIAYYLLGLSILSTNCRDNYMTCLCSITINNSSFHFL